MQMNEKSTEAITENIKEKVSEGFEKVSQLLGFNGQAETALTPAKEDALQFLARQHKEVENLFADFDRAGPDPRKTREAIAAQVVEKLTLHAQLEETYFYPRVKEADKDLVLEAAEEHDSIKHLVSRLQAFRGEDDVLKARMTTLKEQVQHHVKEEENNLFLKCRANFSDEMLLEIGEKMQKAMAAGPMPKRPAKASAKTFKKKAKIHSPARKKKALTRRAVIAAHKTKARKQGARANAH